jgi:primosomal protein N' (replication factor Y) (superfamily II helicase)
VLGEPHDLGALALAKIGERLELPVLGLLEVHVDGPAVWTAFGLTELFLDAIDHVVGERVPEQVRLHVGLGGRVAHEVGEEPLDDAVLADDALGVLAALRGQDRLLVLAALDEAVGLEALEHLSGRRARDAEHVGDAHRQCWGTLRFRLVLPDGEGQEVDRLEIVVDGVPSRHVGDDPSVARFASVVPLVSARALARPFTYLADGLEKGAVVSVRFGRASRRGVVVRLEDKAPPEVEPVAVEGVLGAVPEPLVDLALWVAEYYGSTPARALGLVAPALPARRAGARRRRRPEELPAEEAPDEPSPPQAAALARIERAMEGGGGAFLLYGATGSGKTEVYLRACERALASGRGSIVLVPEIALTPQALGRFRSRFGERVAVLHSALTEAERRDERERIATGRAPIVVGARSAIFAPVPALGLICVDEEHDSSYKQESDPRYDARTVAAKRAALEGAVAVYGSATPRPESWQGLERLELGGRLAGPLPPVRVVDLRREAGYPLSAPLLDELGRLADRGGKAILLLNRRGIAPALHCRACGLTLRCPDCDVALTLHADGRLHCHHCGRREQAPELCPACGAAEVARLGAGTEKLETELATRLPELERFRLDADVAGRPGKLSEVLAGFAGCERGVLLGTQMVGKGHHFRGVALAAVVDADTALGLPDFRAEERTFQLVTQLAGRSGRDAPGRVLVQTYQPDARPIALAARHGVEEFLAGELERRRELGYPPFRHLVRIAVSGPSQAGPVRLLTELRSELERSEAAFDLLGPAPLLRLRGRHRAQLLVKTDTPRRVASRVAALLAAAAPAMRRDGLAVSVDVDPQGVF